MKTTTKRNGSSQKIMILIRVFVIAGILLSTVSGQAQLPPGWKGIPTNSPLDSWSFHDNTNWASDLGYVPVLFTNLNFSQLGNGASLVVDTNVTAWLQYNVYETNGATNLTVDVGSVTFWFAPNWASTNQGGNGPGEYGRLIEVGGYTPDSSYGWWSLYVDDGGNNLSFSAQTNDLSGSVTTYLSAPISWTTNYFHFIALTYCATNTVLYVDGALATNGPPLAVYPGPDVLAGGFFIGSDSNGVLQAHGLYNTVATYNYPLDSNTVQRIFNWEDNIYLINPWNLAYMANISSAPSSPSYSPAFDAVTGQGYLLFVTNTSTCITSTNVWITNVVVTVAGNGTMNLKFSIEGGQDLEPFDVFANSILDFSSSTNVAWAWLGQGYHCNTYMLTNLPNTTCFLILGTPQDSDSDGLTDAYEKLVSKTDPHNPDTSGDGMLDGWKVLWGLNPLANNTAQPSERLNYTYNLTDWLDQISGTRSGSVGLDAEGNVQSASQ